MEVVNHPHVVNVPHLDLPKVARWKVECCRVACTFIQLGCGGGNEDITLSFHLRARDFTMTCRTVTKFCFSAILPITTFLTLFVFLREKKSLFFSQVFLDATVLPQMLPAYYKVALFRTITYPNFCYRTNSVSCCIVLRAFNTNAMFPLYRSV
jgi:hypothetical protein